MEANNPLSEHYTPEFGAEVHYHGSPDPISQFDNVTGRGISFTTDRGHAEGFGPNVHEVRLSVKNPLDLTHLGTGAEDGDENGHDERVSTEQIAAALAEHGIRVQFGRPRKGWTTDLLRSVMPDVIRQASAKGFDAVKVMDFKDNENEETVVFSPKQVRAVASTPSDRAARPAAPPPDRPAPARRQPWEMVRAEYAAGLDPDDPYGPDAHKAIVSRALAAGKAVPPEVLKDYPDLAAKS